MAQPAQPSANQNDDNDLAAQIQALIDQGLTEWYRIDPAASPANRGSMLPSAEALAEMDEDRTEDQRQIEELIAMGIQPESSTTSTEILMEDREDRC